MQIKITPHPLGGSVQAPVSKSVAHRLLICAALGDRPCTIHCNGTNADIQATVRCLSALGATIAWEEGLIHVTPIPRSAPPHSPDSPAILDCGESGSTLRFLLPAVCALNPNATFIGQGRLPSRPLSPLYEELIAHGALLSENGKLPLIVSSAENGLSGGTFTIDGGISSQFISGLLFALPLLGKPCEIVVTGRLESAQYIDLTLSALRQFGIIPEPTEHGWRFTGTEHYRSPEHLTVEGDWSNAAFWLAAGALSPEPITIEGLSGDSLQGDKAIVNLLQEFGATIEQDGDRFTVRSSSLRGIHIDATHIPDLVPILSVVAAYAEGETSIRNIARLRIKESDRVATTLFLLGALGVIAFADEDTLTVIGASGFMRPTISAPRLSSYNDHRIAMAATIGAAYASPDAENNTLIIENAQAVQKSYPDFYEQFRRLQGLAEEI